MPRSGMPELTRSSSTSTRTLMRASTRVLTRTRTLQWTVGTEGRSSGDPRGRSSGDPRKRGHKGRRYTGQGARETGGTTSSIFPPAGGTEGRSPREWRSKGHELQGGMNHKRQEDWRSHYRWKLVLVFELVLAV